ncbi:MAG: phosphatidate cytidylyltransferase [Bacteroidetes bacterium]|nr:phosphatidate cytidylyltransferase [Bacteroidota bacterium]MCW5895382.1 phosphatidate cytidylyltransferase [Bacteroidota bacterium]
MKNLTQRILVALVSIPLIVVFSWWGGLWFFGMVLLIAVLGLNEFYTLAARKGAAPQVVTGLVFGALVLCVFIWQKLQFVILTFAGQFGVALPMPTMAQLFLILFLIFVPLIMLLELFRNKGSALLNVATTLFGVCYVSLFLGSLIGVRELFIPADFPVWLHFEGHGIDYPAEVVRQVYDWGGATVITVFVSIWVCDTLAYFAGRLLGKHKLFERVSPNKTWEGAVAGYVGAVATFLVAQSFFLPYMTVGSALVCGSIVGIFGQAGDLAESLLKRDAGVKDSSALIPGHGGVLDRFDSLLFVSPLIFFYLDFVVF